MKYICVMITGVCFFTVCLSAMQSANFTAQSAKFIVACAEVVNSTDTGYAAAEQRLQQASLHLMNAGAAARARQIILKKKRILSRRPTLRARFVRKVPVFTETATQTYTADHVRDIKIIVITAGLVTLFWHRKHLFNWIKHTADSLKKTQECA